MSNQTCNEEQARKDILEALYHGSGHHLILVNLYDIGNPQGIKENDFADVINKLVRSEHIEIKRQSGDQVNNINGSNVRGSFGTYFVYLTDKGISKYNDDSRNLWEGFIHEVKRIFPNKLAVLFYAGLGIAGMLLVKWLFG